MGRIESMSSDKPESHASADSHFQSTHWSTVLQAGQDSSPEMHKALEALCRVYWYPLYAYLRHFGYPADSAQDLVQGFFANLLEKGAISVATPSRGRFRSFLLTSLRNFTANQRDKGQAEKRGGTSVILTVDASQGESRYATEPSHELTAERLYERQWAVALLDNVTGQLRKEYLRAGKGWQFECLKAFLAGRSPTVRYAQAAEQLRITQSAAMTAASRLRQRYRELLRSEIARTVAHPDEVDDEIVLLFNSLSS
jgi:DNA-directed RNA polymerase specialized sigma24 family protein